MKRYPKIVQVDARGQIVIPKDIRRELGVDEGSGFFMFSVGDNGILLRKIADERLSEDDELMSELLEKSDKAGISQKHLRESVRKYKKTKDGNLEVL